jgi:hypothetical protein
MRISDMRRAGLALGLVAALGACDPAALGGASDSTRVTVAGRDITIAAPPGFCVDPASTSVGAAGAFVMVSDCALLGGRPNGRPPAGAVMTASVASATVTPAEGDGEGAGSLAELERFAATAQGRALLGRSGQGNQVRIAATRTRGGVLYMLIEDRGAQPIDGIERQFWRAFLEVQGQLAVISVLGFEGAGVGPTEGLAYLQSFADAIQRANS